MQDSEVYLSTARAALAQVRACVATITDNTLEKANDIAILLDRVMSEASLYQSVHPKKELRDAAELVEQEASRLATDLALDRRYYDAVAATPETGLDAESKRFRSHTLRDFRRSGVDKDEATRNAIKQLNEELVAVSQEFGRNIREDVRTLELDSSDALRGLPPDYIAQHASNPVIITTDYPDYVPFLSYADDSAARQKLYTLYRQRGFPKNVAVFAAMLEKRHALAKLLGYAHFADYLTETRMIKNAANAQAFVDRIAALAKPAMERDYKVLLAQKKKTDPSTTAVSEWERGYLEEKVKHERFGFSAQDVRPYFPYAGVKRGVLAVCAKLFAVSFEQVEKAQWHPSVETYKVVQDSKTIGRFMLDMHPRKDKYKHAAQFTLQSGIKGRQEPIGVLVCNFPEPCANNAALMEHKDVVTFFHEFGHLLHHLFGGHQRYARFSGVATEWDFVEAPSQMLEEWAWDKDVLARFAKHHETGEVIPPALVEKMRAADEFAKGIQARVQMFYAALSLAFYSIEPSSIDSRQLLADLQARYSPFAYVPDTHLHLSFGHLDGYSAGYYTYMWSLVIAKDLFSAFEKYGLMDPGTATRYRDRVLARGGADDAAKLVHDFLGRDYSFDAFERWLSRAA